MVVFSYKQPVLSKIRALNSWWPQERVLGATWEAVGAVVGGWLLGQAWEVAAGPPPCWRTPALSTAWREDGARAAILVRTQNGRVAGDRREGDPPQKVTENLLMVLVIGQ